MTGPPAGRRHLAGAPRPRLEAVPSADRPSARRSAANYDALAMGKFVLFPAAALPPALRDRAVPLYAVSLRESETPEMFGEKIMWPLDAGDVELLRLIAAGCPTRKIAVETGVSMRTVQRQVARLRRRLKLHSTTDLRQYLRDRGFDVDTPKR